MILLFLCLAVSVHDGDTLRCQDGTRIRIAGIEANEIRGGCHLPVCPAMPAPEARAWLERLTMGRTLKCRRVGVSYRRTVAECSVDGRDIRCAAISAGAVVDWPRYSRGLRRCGR